MTTCSSVAPTKATDGGGDNVATSSPFSVNLSKVSKGSLDILRSTGNTYRRMCSKSKGVKCSTSAASAASSYNLSRSTGSPWTSAGKRTFL
jgi:hypothetical protein